MIAGAQRVARSEDEDRTEGQLLLEAVRGLISDGRLSIRELQRRLPVADMRQLRDDPADGCVLSRAACQRLQGLITMGTRRAGGEPGGVRIATDDAPLVIGPFGTVAHEVETVRLLMIEFDSHEDLAICRLLESAQDTVFEIVRAAHIEDAPDLIQDGSVDVALLNLSLSASEGPISMARAEVVTAGIPIVSLIESSDEPALLHMGDRGYLVKRHLSSRLLVRTLRTAVERHRLQCELAEAQQREQFHATRDAMTGLPNRFHFEEQLARSIAFARRTRGQVAIYFLDLDRFKHINDTLGHDVGDGLINTMADRLSHLSRKSDMVARVGGDQFLLLVQGPELSHAAGLVGDKILAALARPFRVDGREYSFTGSVGISLYPRDGDRPEELVRKADAAMYQAKARGRASYEFYNEQLSALSERKLHVEGRLRGAIERGHLSVYYQARVDARNGRIVGAEALARWTDPELGFVAPSEFIPIAEESGIISSVDHWVMETALQALRSWNEAGYDDLRLSVNVSARQLQDAAVNDAILCSLERSGVAARRLEVELTESALIENAEVATDVLEALSALGVGVSLDDFGTGFSSLAYLKRFPVNTIKIDQSFVRDMLDDADDAAITEAIISIAYKLRLGLIAEGVESEEQLGFLCERGCYEMQGFLFSPPLSARDFLALLQRGLPERPKRIDEAEG